MKLHVGDVVADRKTGERGTVVHLWMQAARWRVVAVRFGRHRPIACDARDLRRARRLVPSR
jgi:hypothetical protein